MFSKSDVRRWSRRQIVGQGTPLPLAGRLALLSGLLVFVALAAFNARAQDNVTLPTYTCTAEDYATVTKIIDEQLATLSQPDADPALAMVLIRAALDTYQAKCTGGTFTKATHPNGIIGPIVFTGSLYQATLQITPGDFAYGSAKWTTISGDCGLFTLLSVTDGKGDANETDVLKFKDCVALFEVDASEGDWTFTLAKLN